MPKHVAYSASGKKLHKNEKGRWVTHKGHRAKPKYKTRSAMRAARKAGSSKR